ncbi:uncharacterized protein LOC131635637 [Vicia villosa]|uniref:uncharacterized protein LOC131635637 n=1 Tax=Vicia villosa TaxID=3911 RepID=UPI00273BE8CE|nr:uncharacterized protein LOC131635637 [Vicia villosa]
MESRKLWVDVISSNRNLGNDMKTEFIAPKIVIGVAEVMIEEEDIVNEVKFGDTTLIMYVLGGNLSMHIVKKFIMKQWNFAKLLDMYYNNEGYFVLTFHSYQDRDVVLRNVPYRIQNMPMLLTEWKSNFNLKKDMLRTILVWIQLPLHLWGVTSLVNISSILSITLMTDECITNRYQISYAKILVELDITQEIVDEIIIGDENG